MLRGCAQLVRRPIEPCKFCEYAAGKGDRELLHGAISLSPHSLSLTPSLLLFLSPYPTPSLSSHLHFFLFFSCFSPLLTPRPWEHTCLLTPPSPPDDDSVVVFRSRSPVAATHLLVIPKQVSFLPHHFLPPLPSSLCPRTPPTSPAPNPKPPKSQTPPSKLF